jgi:hypothetical protein
MRFKNISRDDLLPTALRFWSKVSIKDPEKCWEWTAALKDNGYGYFRISKELGMISAHKAAYIITNGTVPEGMYVCHRCDNRKCANPNHLWLGSAVENQRDMASKGRNVSPAKVLSDEDKAAICGLRLAGVERGALSERFSVTKNHITRVCRIAKEN